ncbi:type II secretion system F family protein [Robiginitomaculum antarcticum]|uniref:type II secretion system F family protein n=1 Tax=Robiginitomaculum antarcticum TaxID=437507 RepID=UPI0003A877B8|nr:type II secretion system F family protein [Robiginitomaculum antarcticum]
MDFLTLTVPPMAIITISIVFLAASITLVFMSIKTTLEYQKNINRRLKPHTTAGVKTSQEPSSSIFKRYNLAKFATKITLPHEAEITRTRYLLSQAGYFSPSAVKTFYGLRTLAVIVPQFILISSWGYLAKNYEFSTLIFTSATFAILGLFGPGFIVKRKKKRRTLLCREGFPDMMDLLVACIEAGLGLDAAMNRVAEELGQRYPPLKVGLDLMNLELRAGRPRHEAMLNFANRVDLEEARALTTMLKQSEDMGSSLGTALRSFSEEMRSKRMLLAEEKALALSAKLTVPLILFIFPTIIILLLMPAGIRLAGAF